MKKICLISSSGGHYEQILMLKKLNEFYEVFVITEKTKYNSDEKNIYLIQQVNRKEKLFLFKMTINFFKLLKIYFQEKPDVIISTGALSVIPMFLIGKIMNKKLIFIESFAKTNTPTMTGKLLYRFTDLFIVQWDEMKKVYPNAIVLGSIY
ncbi:UDP-N-acetylglucosamine--N-acetylmuramyl-(pentapeptide) pyrophosphoryl-undecaprenol N-acetylglucosamine transferase [Enterococcus casseliflavus]|uniref:UDP-N-acetylglucosamine--N-acetylmuramyl-(Pentapeptide) pyrophosphoryl-undecaprenol N-acetylglucosamine transferase n=1 Tax=Enterococcus casseliflavus TaxID=37734 RepID=A0A6N3FNE7_ENTCA